MKRHIVLITLLLIVAVIQAHAPRFTPTATIDMDGPGHFLVDNYKVQGKCVTFLDGIRHSFHYCGAFAVRLMTP